jgi:hypothetical protein
LSAAAGTQETVVQGGWGYSLIPLEDDASSAQAFLLFLNAFVYLVYRRPVDQRLLANLLFIIYYLLQLEWW